MSVRFAPSPTGTFHVGNLRTAFVAQAWARALARPLVVRFEDIDGPRVVPGAMEQQLADLHALGVAADVVLVQSARAERHWSAFAAAAGAGVVYPCTCSRRSVREAIDALASAPHGAAPVYNGRCRDGAAPAASSVGWRFRAEDPSGHGDFVVARSAALEPDRASFQPAYHWACAVDDFDGEHDLLVRAYDLWDAAAQQRALMGWLGEWSGRARAAPAVFHTALVTQDDGARLEKRTRGVTLAELAARGLSAEAVTSRFAASFALPPWVPGALFGEDRRTLTLWDLNLST